MNIDFLDVHIALLSEYINSFPSSKAPISEDDFRKRITEKWCAHALGSALLVATGWVILNKFVTPIYQKQLDSEQPPRILRRSLLYLPWIKYSMWAWTFFICVVSLKETYFDLPLIARRTGRLVMVFMLPMYLFTLRPSPLPETAYLAILPIHKWLSRVVVLLSLVHTVIYLFQMHKKGTMFKILFFKNVCGVALLIMFVAVGVTAFYSMRRRNYQAFYVVHIITAWGSMPLLYYHSRKTCNKYIAGCTAMLLYQVVYRIMRSYRVKLRVQVISPTLVIIDIPKTRLPHWLQSWSPGAHVRISGTLLNPLTWVTSSHPYTVASLPQDPTLRLLIRHGKYRLRMRTDYCIYGNFRALPSFFEQEVTADKVKRVLFVVGGSGIAFGAPLFRYLKLNGVHVKMLWAIRNPEDAKCLPALSMHQSVLDGDVEIYYTGGCIFDEGINNEEEVALDVDNNDCVCDAPSPVAVVPQPRRFPSIARLRGAPEALSQQIQKNNQEPFTESRKDRRKVRKDELLAQYQTFMFNQRPHLNLKAKMWMYGQSLDSNDCCCADRVIDMSDEHKKGVWVISTGVPRMVRDAREWAKASGVNFFEEEFSM